MIHSGVINTIQLIHTISGKHCYFITFVFPSLRSGTRDVRSSSSLLCWHPSSHTASGRCCCNLNQASINIKHGRLLSFNTASGRYCYFITFVFPSFQSGTRDVRTSSSLRSSAASHPSSHTASGRCCCNYETLKMTLNPFFKVGFNTASGKCCCNSSASRPCRYRAQVSIPQAVSAVASSPLFSLPFGQGLEMCGPHRRFAPLLPRTLRRIPQAVGAVATNDGRLVMTFIIVSFNTASGKYCCNDGEGKKVYNWVPGFQYRKR